MHPEQIREILKEQDNDLASLINVVKDLCDQNDGWQFNPEYRNQKCDELLNRICSRRVKLCAL